MEPPNPIREAIWDFYDSIVSEFTVSKRIEKEMEKIAEKEVKKLIDDLESYVRKVGKDYNLSEDELVRVISLGTSDAPDEEIFSKETIERLGKKKVSDIRDDVTTTLEETIGETFADWIREAEKRVRKKKTTSA